MSDLIVAHNLNAAKLETIDLMGGMACPSLAIIDNQNSFHEFGDITLLMDADKISPKTESIFHSDVYSPRTPLPKYHVDRIKLIEIGDRVKQALADIGLSELPLPGELSGSESLSKGMSFTVSGLVREEALLAVYASSKGITFDIPYEETLHSIPFLNGSDDVFDAIANLPDDAREPGTESFEKLNAAAMKLVDDYAERSSGNIKNAKARILRDWFDKNGDEYTINDILAYMLIERAKEGRQPPSIDTYALRDALVEALPKEDVSAWLEDMLSPAVGEAYFPVYNDHGEETRVPYTLDNLTNYLKGDIRGQEDFFYGAGTLRSLMAGQFNSWEDVATEKGRLVSDKDFDPVGEALNEKFAKFANLMKDYMPKSSDAAMTNSIAYSHLTEYAKTRNADGLKPYVRVDDIPKEYFEQFDKFLVELEQAPTGYFEVKMQRSVSLNEFDVAVVPDSISDKTKQLLANAGVNIAEYRAGDNEHRMEVMKAQPVVTVENVSSKPVLDMNHKVESPSYSSGPAFR